MKHSQISILMLSVLATVSGLFSACSSDEDEALLQPSSKTVTVTAGIAENQKLKTFELPVTLKPGVWNKVTLNQKN